MKQLLLGMRCRCTLEEHIKQVKDLCCGRLAGPRVEEVLHILLVSLAAFLCVEVDLLVQATMHCTKLFTINDTHCPMTI